LFRKKLICILPVRFEKVEDAEKCIIALRKFRNLHPTFSKVPFLSTSLQSTSNFCSVFSTQQVHKIPGTSYAQAVTPSTSLSSWDEHGHSSNSSSAGDPFGPDATFKAKMESLHDPTSTNLYIEG